MQRCYFPKLAWPKLLLMILFTQLFISPKNYESAYVPAPSDSNSSDASPLEEPALQAVQGTPKLGSRAKRRALKNWTYASFYSVVSPFLGEAHKILAPHYPHLPPLASLGVFPMLC